MTCLADVWTYQCGKCGKDFKTKAERDQHMIGCGQEPKPNCRSRSSSPERWKKGKKETKVSYNKKTILEEAYFLKKKFLIEKVIVYLTK